MLNQDLLLNQEWLNRDPVVFLTHVVLLINQSKKTNFMLNLRNIKICPKV